MNIYDFDGKKVQFVPRATNVLGEHKGQGFQ